MRFFFNKAQVRFCEASQVFRIGTDRFVAAPWSLARKGRQLAAFQKVELDPGENRTVELRIRPRASSCFDPDHNGWVTTPGTCVLHAGTSSRDLPVRHAIGVCN